MHTPQAQGQSQKNGPWILGPSSFSFDGFVVGALLRCLHTPPGRLMSWVACKALVPDEEE